MISRSTPTSKHRLPESPDPQGPKDAEPQTVTIIIQPNILQYQYNMDATLQIQADKLLCRLCRPKFDSQVTKMMEVIRQQLKPLKAILEEYFGQKAEIEQLAQSVKNQITVIVSKDQIIKNIEDNYMDQINQIKQGYESKQKDLIELVDKLQLENTLLRSENELHKQERANLLEFNQALSEKANSLEGRLLIEATNNKLLSQQVESLKDIRGGLLTVQNAYKAIFNQEFQPQTLSTLLTSKNRHRIFEFLLPRDIHALLLTSKQMYFLIQNNRSLISHIIYHRTSSLKKEIDFLKKEIGYFQELAQRAPEEVVQIGIAKFLVFKLNIGSYMIDVFNDAFELIEGRVQAQAAVQSPPLQQYQNEDLIGLNEIEQPQPASSQILNQSYGFFQKVKSMASQSSPSTGATQKKQLTLSDLSLAMLAEFKGIDSLILEALEVPYLRAQLQQTRRDMSELVKRSQQINQQLFQIGLKCIPNAQNGNPKLSVQDFMSSLQKIFSRLLTYSHYMQLESQQLNQVCNYLTQKLQKQYHQIIQQQSTIDDQQEEIGSLKHMKVHIQTRVRNLEERVMQVEDQKLKLSQSNYDQQQAISQMTQKINQISEQLKEKEHKLHQLAQGWKQMKQDKELLEQKLKTIMTTFTSIKHLLPVLLEQ